MMVGQVPKRRLKVRFRFRLTEGELPEGTVYTASEAQVEFMAENIPAGAKVTAMDRRASYI